MSIFRFFKVAAAAILDFQIFVNFNNRNAQEGQTASPSQISWKSVTCKNSQNCIECVIAMTTQSNLTIPDRKQRQNRLNLSKLHIIILATSVGQTSCTISHWLKLFNFQHPQQCGEHPHQEMASYGPVGSTCVAHTSPHIEASVPAHVVQCVRHSDAMCSRAWRSQWPRIDSSLGPGASAY